MPWPPVCFFSHSMRISIWIKTIVGRIMRSVQCAHIHHTFKAHKRNDEIICVQKKLGKHSTLHMEVCVSVNVRGSICACKFSGIKSERRKRARTRTNCHFHCATLNRRQANTHTHTSILFLVSVLVLFTCKIEFDRTVHDSIHILNLISIFCYRFLFRLFIA